MGRKRTRSENGKNKEVIEKSIEPEPETASSDGKEHEDTPERRVAKKAKKTKSKAKPKSTTTKATTASGVTLSLNDVTFAERIQAEHLRLEEWKLRIDHFRALNEAQVHRAAAANYMAQVGYFNQRAQHEFVGAWQKASELISTGLLDDSYTWDFPHPDPSTYNSQNVVAVPPVAHLAPYFLNYPAYYTNVLQASSAISSTDNLAVTAAPSVKDAADHTAGLAVLTDDVIDSTLGNIAAEKLDEELNDGDGDQPVAGPSPVADDNLSL